jgi:DNA repair protein Crb2 Tudor domain/BRCA1 C Terminus (BRCT) domain
VTSKSSPLIFSTSDEKLAAAKMHRTFAGFVGELGDTQPMTSQVFKEYSDLTASRIAAQKRAEDGEPGSEQEVESRPLQERESRYINLLNGAPEPQEIEEDSLSSIESDIDDRDMKNVHNSMFRVPKTPATARPKRDAGGEPVSSELRTSATRTPGSALATMFGPRQTTTDMSLTQIFQNTQLATSPAVGEPRSDPIFQRPSPNIHMQDSLPMGAHFDSSPTKLPRSDTLRATSDPLDTYTSMKESQERRERRLREEQEEEARRKSEVHDEFAEYLAAEDGTTALRKAREKMTHAALSDTAQLTAPGRKARGIRSKSLIDDQSDWTVTPPTAVRSTRNKKNVIEISDDPNEEDEFMDDDINAPTSAVQVPMTSSRPNGPSQLAHAIPSSPTTREGERAVKRVKITTTSMPPLTREETHDTDANVATQKSVAIADSQDAPRPEDSLPRPPINVPSSPVSSHRIIQSQKNIFNRARDLLNSNIRAAIDTSSAPKPPPGTSQTQEETVPSSPPIEPLPQLDEEMEDVSDDEVDLSVPSNTPADGPRKDSAVDKSAAVKSQLEKDDLLTVHEDPDPEPLEGPDELLDHVQSSAAQSNANGTSVFASARTHLSASPRKFHLRQRSAPNRSPQARTGGFRKLTDIANDPTPNPSIESLDVNNINILTDEDREFLHTVSGIRTQPSGDSAAGSSPVQPAKRRKADTHVPLRDPARNVNVQEPPKTSSEKEPSGQQFADPSSLEASTCLPVPRKIKAHRTYGRPRKPEMGKLKRPTKQTALATKKPPTTPAANPHSPVSPQAPTDSTRSAGGPVQHSHSVVLQLPGDAVPVEDPDDQPPAEMVAAHATEIGQNDTNNVICPDRVLALFNGGSMYYYPATCLGPSRADASKLKIRFDDGTIDNLDSSKVSRLDLRIGDQLKVDLNKMRSKGYIVQGFKDKIATATANGDSQAPISTPFLLTDIRGYQTLQLAVKPSRTSLLATDPAETIDVRLADVYLTTAMFLSFKDRQYHVPEAEARIKDPLLTPVTLTSEATTPNHRPRRQVASTTAHVNLREAFTSPTAHGPKIFTGMAFAVSFGAGLDEEKAATTKTLVNGNAQILDKGFEDLFQPSSMTVETPIPPKKSKSNHDESTQLGLKDWAKSLGFTALITDTHSRRSKYMEALALGLPCVHFRWVKDCMEAGTVVPFEKYLLPAGESSFLGCAIRSRTLTTYDPLGSDAALKDVLERRDALLDGQKVILVAAKGKGEERQKTYAFLSFAMGAEHVRRVKDSKEAKALCKSEKWDIVHVSGNRRDDVESPYFATEDSSSSKRKRASAGLDTAATVQKGDGRKVVKVVDDEWVVQSLILGSLL